MRRAIRTGSCTAGTVLGTAFDRFTNELVANEFVGSNGSARFVISRGYPEVVNY